MLFYSYCKAKMGIHSVMSFLETIFHDNKRPLKTLKGKTIVIDFLNVAHRLLSNHSGKVNPYTSTEEDMNSFRNNLVNLVHKFIRDGVQVIFILDGMPSEEKAHVLEERKMKREGYKKVLEKMLQELEPELAPEPVLAPVLAPEQNTESIIVSILQLEQPKQVINSKEVNISNPSPPSPPSKKTIIDDKKMRSIIRNTRKITIKHIIVAKELFDILGIQYMHLQDVEADNVFKYMLDNKLADIVYSADMDCLLYGCSKVMFYLDFLSDCFKEFNLADILKHLNITFEQLQQAMILSGTDFNFGLVNSNFENNIKLIKKYGTITEILHNLDEINRDIPDDTKHISIPPIRFDYDKTFSIYNDSIQKHIQEEIQYVLECQTLKTKQPNIKKIDSMYSNFFEFDKQNSKLKYSIKFRDCIYSQFKYQIKESRIAIPKPTSQRTVRRQLVF